MSTKTQSYKICEKCKQEMKPVKIIGNGQQKMGTLCECGIFTKTGKKLD